MREPRNPFRLRSSENAESPETFVRLFSPEALDVLEADNIWKRPQIIHSAPGGGKTSLLRLFTPASLRAIYSHKNQKNIKDLFKKLTALDAIGDDGPHILGVYLSCIHSFATLEDLSIEDTKKKRLFLSLLNARIMLAILQSVLDMRQEEYPGDLDRISIKKKDIMATSYDIPPDLTGKSLYKWAQDLECIVCDALDSFAPLSEVSLPGHNSLISLDILGGKPPLFDNKNIASRVVLMLDDVHKLTSKQREWLLDTILNMRSSTTVWIAERLEALNVDKLFSEGANKGRDYDEVTIEDYWRGSRAPKFVKLLSSVADRRAVDVRVVEMGPFESCLQDSLNSSEWQDLFGNSIPVVSERVRKRVSNTRRFSEWINEREHNKGTPRERLLAWKKLEILIERDLGKAQQAFDFELSVDELENKEDTNIQAAAELFCAHEFKFPYYYGLRRLAYMASSNIEQFLMLAGDIFEECVSAALLRQSITLSPKRQEEILRKTINEAWRRLPNRIPYATQVMNFLESIGKMASGETYKPNAPYAPGVTGVAISMSEREILRERSPKSTKKTFELLTQVIATCIAHNLLEVNLNMKCKGQYWMVMYLNRMLCLKFNLPLQYGGWKERRLSELHPWLNKLPSNRPSGLFR
jgi:hypothetical protein